MTKEDKQIIDRAVKETWRIGDRTRLKHLLEKNLEQYRDNVELENKNKLLGERCNQLLKDKGELTDKIADIKANCDLAIEGRDIKIKELTEENAVLERRIERAKECMKKLLFIINSDPANYNCKGLVQDAEDFIHNRTCNIRLHGEHCISETRCIMCDKEIEK